VGFTPRGLYPGTKHIYVQAPQAPVAPQQQAPVAPQAPAAPQVAFDFRAHGKKPRAHCWAALDGVSKEELKRLTRATLKARAGMVARDKSGKSREELKAMRKEQRNDTDWLKKYLKERLLKFAGKAADAKIVDM
jgi:hypothetical protein